MKLLIQLVREISHLSGKSQGKVREFQTPMAVATMQSLTDNWPTISWGSSVSKLPKKNMNHIYFLALLKSNIVLCCTSYVSKFLFEMFCNIFVISYLKIEIMS